VTAGQQAGTVRAAFTDPVSGEECALVVPPGGGVFPLGGQAKIGIAHPRCAELADLEVGLDAFWCPACRWNGRVSGGWCVDVIRGEAP
jgi:hypothetical protein